jgi:hypothetical protein
MKALVLALALVSVSACARSRSIKAPVSGAVSRTYSDSAAYVFEVATYAVTDEGIGIMRTDPERQIVESDWVDVGSLRHVSPAAAEAVVGADRRVRFRFRAVPVAGGTQLIGEALIRPIGGGEFADRMVPRNHPAREVLIRMLDNASERLGKTRR